MFENGVAWLVSKILKDRMSSDPESAKSGDKFWSLWQSLQTDTGSGDGFGKGDLIHVNFQANQLRDWINKCLQDANETEYYIKSTCKQPKTSVNVTNNGNRSRGPQNAPPQSQGQRGPQEQQSQQYQPVSSASAPATLTGQRGQREQGIQGGSSPKKQLKRSENKRYSRSGGKSSSPRTKPIKLMQRKSSPDNVVHNKKKKQHAKKQG
jgi:hypothetical protein